MITIDSTGLMTLPDFLLVSGVNLRITFRDNWYRVDNLVVGLKQFDMEYGDVKTFDEPTPLNLFGRIEEIMRNLAQCVITEACKLTVDGIPLHTRDLMYFQMEHLTRLNTQRVTNYREPA